MNKDRKFLIDVPPPTVSGTLHMGHVFSYTHMDFIARYHRHIKDEYLVYPYCYDNNGLPTEKLAQAEGVHGQNQIIDFSHGEALAYHILFMRLAMAYSWHHYSTFSPFAVRLAELSFHDLVAKGQAYKAERDYFYCPVTKVSVSQNELTDDGCYERSGAKVEIRRGEGWFIKVLDNLPRIRAAIDQIRWKPEKYKERLLAWLDQCNTDWSISRERTYGIPIPGEPPGIVFDTWHTSSLSPQLAWHEEGKYENTLQCPIFDVRFQAHDIIRTWALFTIIKSVLHNDQIPWRNIVISGHALDPKGKKISKTAENYTPPNEYFDQHTSDGVRYWAAQPTIGSDTRINPVCMEYGKRCVTKWRNAKRFLDMRTDDGVDEAVWKEWLERKEGINAAFEDYDWPEASELFFEYFWHCFCAIRIEESKRQPMNGTLRAIYDDMREYMGVFMPGTLINPPKPKGDQHGTNLPTQREVGPQR